MTHCPQLSFLIDHRRTFGLVWSVLGWNVHVYHSHVDVHPRRPQSPDPHWGWHQDGGRQNRELAASHLLDPGYPPLIPDAADAR